VGGRDGGGVVPQGVGEIDVEAIGGDLLEGGGRGGACVVECWGGHRHIVYHAAT